MFPSRQGIALVITLIMLSVITFMAVTFLVLSRREKGSVVTATDQTTARLAADAALERAKAEVLAPILANSNALDFDLLVSTNFINWNGFDPGAVDYHTNVNYDYKIDGSLNFTLAEQQQNLANLLYNPRPPVFISNRLAPPNADSGVSNEFRFFLNLNRNLASATPLILGTFTNVYDRSGYWPVIGPTGGFLHPNGTEDANPINSVSNYFVGDPEWIGILNRPELPHSSTNFFVSRYAYLVIPAGKTLDLNYIHNYTSPSNGFVFFRNQGVGSWEINLAACLRDLNTNVWNTYDSGTYNPVLGMVNPSVEFDDALSLLRYRAGGNFSPVNPWSVATKLGAAGVNAFQSDFVDGYSAGPLMTKYWGWNVLQDGDVLRTDLPWWGSDTTNHFFTTQDLFDRNKTEPGIAAGVDGFTDRLLKAAINSPSSYDRYTYYRLLSQLGTDSAPEPPGKLNLNYVNVGGLSATNFISWDDPDLRAGNPARGIPNYGVPGSVLFFTNVANQLLRQHTAGWLATNFNSYVRTFGTTNSFGVSDIPVWMNNTQFVYEASVNRLLQLAANLYDATATNIFPSVFRPRFSRLVTNILGTSTLGTNILITGFEEASTDILGASYSPLDIVNFPTNRTFIGTDTITNIVGVPWILGAKKGFPNFNEFTMRTVVSVSRKLVFQKDKVGGTVQSTNQYYYIGISNAFGIEAWNSYLAAYPRELEVLVGGTANAVITNMAITAVGSGGCATNFSEVTNIFFNLSPLKPSADYLANTWQGFTLNPLDPSGTPPVPLEQSFRTMSTNVVVWPHGLPAVVSTNNFPVPFWRVYVRARLQYALVDRGTIPARIVDYVHPGFEDSVDIMDQLTQPPGIGQETEPSELRKVWNPTRVGNSCDIRVPTYGIKEQMDISLGNIEVGDDVWKESDPPAKDIMKKAIDGFRVFMGYGPIYYPPGSIADTEWMMQSPYNPARKFFISKNWEANDPLVHYLASDLLDPESGRMPYLLKPYNSQPPALTNLGTLNQRYQPWGGNPLKQAGTNAYNLTLKDPLVRRSDDWNFPSNKLATLGWIGRVHRGTPWQTVYLKYVPTNDLPLVKWQNWTGNTNAWSALFTRPEADQDLPDLFTVALNENASRGRLSINQRGLAAWSAALSGVIVLSNKLNAATYAPEVEALPIDPAGAYDPNAPAMWPPLVKLVTAINNVRATNFAKGTFTRLGNIFAVPELTLKSPFLNLATDDLKRYSIPDAVYEWLPQQLLSLLQVGDTRFVVYSYGQTLRPADRSIVTSGPFFGLCTNYQITAEVATRAVVRIDGAPTNSHAVVESYNILPPD